MEREKAEKIIWVIDWLRFIILALLLTSYSSHMVLWSSVVPDSSQASTSATVWSDASGWTIGS
jgi:hypothetical protein